MCEERDRRDRSDGPLLPFGFDEALAEGTRGVAEASNSYLE